MRDTNVYEEGRRSRAGYREVTPEAAYRARDSVRLVDVREVTERAYDGFIAGSEHVPLGTVETAARAWNKDEDIILICRSGGRSSRAADLLVALGFARVMNMTGGMVAYAAAGLPVARN